MDAKVIVIGASRYKFPDNKTGEVIEGCKVHYADLNDSQKDDMIGHVPQTANLPYEYFEVISSQPIPGIYEAQLTVDLTARKPALKVVGFRFVQELDLAGQAV